MDSLLPRAEKTMTENEIKTLLLDAIPYPIVFADLDHKIRYLNKRAKYHYYQERGYADLIGKSLFNCHGESSRKKIQELMERFKNNDREQFLRVNVRNERTYMAPVRDNSGNLVGYFERFELNLQIDRP